jgi:hypothetical protein
LRHLALQFAVSGGKLFRGLAEDPEGLGKVSASPGATAGLLVWAAETAGRFMASDDGRIAREEQGKRASDMPAKIAASFRNPSC